MKRPPKRFPLEAVKRRSRTATRQSDIWTRSAVVHDRKALLRRTQGDLNLAAAVTAIFLEECPGTLAELERSVVRRDMKAIERILHRLSGGLETIEGRSAAAAARNLREAALSDSSELEPLFDTLQEELRRLKVELTTLAKEPARP